MKKFIGIIVFFLLLSCSKDNDLNIPKTVNPDPSAGAEVQDFMWKAMNYWYFWQADVPDLADDRFQISEEGTKLYTEFLTSEEDPGAFFDNKLLFSEDRFSYYRSDYKILTQSLSGVSKSNGMEFGLVRLSGTDDLFGYVRYIVPGSDAATKTIQRGDLFTGVDGQTLNLNNYIDLLFGDNDSYVLNMATIQNNTVSPNGEETALTKTPNLKENPIFLDKIFEINGQKIGYLMYNQFVIEYDEDLNEVFGRFKAGGVTDLVIDLRYNPGGYVSSAIVLSSMVHGPNTNDLFLRYRYNTKVQPLYSDSQLNRYFVAKTGAGSNLNSLNLSKVYILATTSSASASELVINCLAPYMDVVQIGEATRGKNEFSITMVDDPESNFGPWVYSPERESKINPKNQWGIQPLVGRSENADGFSDYTSGLLPDIALEEDLGNLGILGDQNEPMLARAIQEITGVTAKFDFTVAMPAKIMTSSKMFTPIKDNMVEDNPLNIKME